MRENYRNCFRRFAIGNRSHNIRLLILLCAFVAGITITTLAVFAFNKETMVTAGIGQPRTEAGPSMPVRSSVAQTISPNMKVAVVTIRPTGFEPSEITKPNKPFLLAVENRSGLQTVQLRIDAVGGNRISDVQMPIKKHDLSQPLNLPPGQYVLTEAYHPEWRCAITVEAK